STNFVPPMAAKCLEVLKEIAPQVRRAALLFNPQTAPYVAEYYQRPFEAAAPSIGVQAMAVLVRQMGEIEAAIGDLAREPGGGLVVPPDNFSYVHRELIFTLAARHRVPGVTWDRDWHGPSHLKRAWLKAPHCHLPLSPSFLRVAPR